MSGQTGGNVVSSNINVKKFLLFTDGGAGANEDIAIVLYQEGSSYEADFSGELTLTNILKSVDMDNLTHDNFWG